jgi:hypothetical protein
MGQAILAAVIALSLSCVPPVHREPKCDSSAITLRLKCIAPGVGAEPVWMTGGRCWCGERPQKTVWIIDRSYPGTLVVYGEALGANAAVYFPSARNDHDRSFVVNDASQTSMVPGGIEPDEEERYAFHPSYVSYSQAGCYRLVATLSGRVVDIVVNQPRCPDCTLATAPPQRP